MESSAALKTCGHSSFLAFCANHEIALCAECYFTEHKQCPDSKMLKEASNEALKQYEQIHQQAQENRSHCQ